jgi:hypothetical protein
MEKNFKNIQEAMTLEDTEKMETVEATITVLIPLIGKRVRVVELPEDWAKMYPSDAKLIGQMVKISNRCFFVEFNREHYLLPYKTKISILKNQENGKN